MAAQNFISLKFIENFTGRFPHRQEKGETAAGNFLADFLAKNGVKIIKQKFITFLPDYKSWKLEVDGEKIECLPVGLVSGEISDNYALVSSLISSQKLIDCANINFNSVCPVISRSNHYFAPSWAIKPGAVDKLIRAKKMQGELQVTKKKYSSCNILVGDTDSPAAILFAHYDSIGPGATDDASGVAVLLKIILEKPELLKNNLFVLAGNEEVSYDFPVYWGHGYRVFEKKFKRQMTGAKEILVVDCVGNAPTVFSFDSAIAKLGFPIINQSRWQGKISSWSGNIEKLMTVYHSEIDTVQQLKEKYLGDAYEKICFKLKKDLFFQSFLINQKSGQETACG